MKNHLILLRSLLLVACFVALECCVCRAADAPERDKNSLGMTLVVISAGRFQRGVTDEHRLRANHRHTIEMGADLQDERPAHPVELTRSFWMGTHEVTVGQFRAFVAASEYKTDAEQDSRGALVFNPSENESPARFVQDARANWRTPGFEQTDDHPVTCVSQRDALAFCAWLSKRENAKYRLPTEAEWEYAARAGGDTIYAGGDTPDTLAAYGNVGDAALEAAHPGAVKRQHLGSGDDGIVYTAAIGKFKPNAWGLYDMHGNVWEWCSDRYYDRYYDELTKAARQKGNYAKPAPTVDPIGPDTTPQHKFGDWRAMRGGCWYTGPMASRSASRAFGESSDAFCYTGFRVVREH